MFDEGSDNTGTAPVTAIAYKSWSILVRGKEGPNYFWSPPLYYYPRTKGKEKQKGGFFPQLSG